MNSKTNVQARSHDAIKWASVILLTCAGIFANQYLHEVAWPLRLAGWIVLASIILFLALNTTRGKRFLVFARDSRLELHKVDWPTRQETTQFTIGVVIMVVLMAFTLWVVDTVLLWVVKSFTG